MKNKVNKIIKAYRLYKERQKKSTNVSYMTNLNTNVIINNDNSNYGKNDFYNYNGKKEDTLKATINANEAYVLRNKNNKAEENLFSGQELYLTEQSSSTQSFFKIQNFIGERDSNGLKKGFCIEKREDGTVFKGIYKQDYLEGYGIQIKDIGVFKGEFEENRTSGFGIYNMKNGVTYTGEWMDEMLFGVGYEIWKDNSSYEGEYNNGVKNGFGTYYVNNNVIYCGEWNNNNMDGFGIYNYPDGKNYIGEWKNNKMNGYGEYHMNEGKKYFGFFKNDKREGFGIYYYPKDDFYIGFWKEGKQNGFGKNIYNGTIRYCFWKLGKKEKTYSSEEEFFEDFDEKEKKCKKFFKWDIDKLKAYLRFQGYVDEENNDLDNNVPKKSKKGKTKKHQRNKKRNEDERGDY